MNWYLQVLRKYAVFSGRARRKEYWYFALFNIIVVLGLVALEVVVGLTGGSSYGLVGGLYTLAALIPGLAVSVRRLHDTGRSGWWMLIGFTPLIGAIVLLVFMVQDSQPGDNSHGPNPKLAVAV